MKLKNFKKTEGTSGATKEMVVLIEMFEKTKEEVTKAIKKGDLFDDLLVKYHCITTSLKYLLSDNECEEMILKDNPKLNKVSIISLIDDMAKQSAWCNQQFQFRNEIREKTNKPIINYNEMSKKLVETWQVAEKKDLVEESKEVKNSEISKPTLAEESKEELKEIKNAVEKLTDSKISEEIDKSEDSK